MRHRAIDLCWFSGGGSVSRGPKLMHTVCVGCGCGGDGGEERVVVLVVVGGGGGAGGSSRMLCITMKLPWLTLRSR